MTRQKIIITCVLIILSFEQLAAQDRYYSTMRNAIGWHQTNFLFDNTIKIDYERRIKDTKYFWQVGFLYYGMISDFIIDDDYYSYYGSNDNNSFTSGLENYHRLTGKGLYFNFKTFIFKDFVYYSVGGQYAKYNVKYYESSFNSYIEDDLEFYYYDREKLNCQEFDKIDFRISTGIQTPLRRTFFLNPFLYVGLSYSLYDKDKKRYNNYGAMGYRGLMFGGGLRVGWGFQRANIKR
jgi:hypothetical protein